MISDIHKCIFIHIPKTAGSSIEIKLGLYDAPKPGSQDHTTIRDIQPMPLRKGLNLLSRRQAGISPKEVLCDLVFPSRSRRATRNQYASYFKFSVVRNPWARVFSWYRNVMRDPAHGIPPCDLHEFLTQYCDNWALQSQMHWLKDFNGRIPMNKIVRFETLATEMEEVLEKLGFADLSLPHVLKSKKGCPEDTFNYREHYDAPSIDLVSFRYREEIELFGYSFES